MSEQSDIATAVVTSRPDFQTRRAGTPSFTVLDIDGFEHSIICNCGVVSEGCDWNDTCERHAQHWRESHG